MTTSEQNARFAIDGAIEYGKQGINKPPSEDHWLMPYWIIGQKLAQLDTTATATHNALQPNWAGEFASYQQWVDKGQSWLKSPSHRPPVCIDAKGRRCTLGADMRRAMDEDAFPVRYFWDFVTTPSAGTEDEEEQKRRAFAGYFSKDPATGDWTQRLACDATEEGVVPLYATFLASKAVSEGGALNVPQDVLSDAKEESASLSARIYRRDSTQEWVLELEGSINGTSFTSRHTEPLTTPLEDVAGLPSLYQQQADTHAATNAPSEQGRTNPEVPIMLNGLPVERIRLDWVCAFLSDKSIFDGNDLQQAFDKLVAFYAAHRNKDAGLNGEQP